MHACPDHGSKPSVNQGYWTPKLARNVARDRATDAALELAGWQVIRLWEHVPLGDAVALVVTALGPGASPPGPTAALGPRQPPRAPRGAWLTVTTNVTATTRYGLDSSPGRRTWHTRDRPRAGVVPAPFRRTARYPCVYICRRPSALTAALKTGEIGPAPILGFAVTPTLREGYASGDLDELEYVAPTEAARASLRQLADDPGAPARRVVLAEEVAEGDIGRSGDHGHPAAVQVLSAIPFTDVAAGDIDGLDAADDVRAAIAAVAAADEGDEDARFTVDSAEGHELMWYATQELEFFD